MNSEGVTKALPDEENHTVMVNYDDEKTTLEKIMHALEEGGYPVEGEPQFMN